MIWFRDEDLRSQISEVDKIYSVHLIIPKFKIISTSIEYLKDFPAYINKKRKLYMFFYLFDLDVLP